MKLRLLAITAVLILNAHKTHTEKSFLEKLFTSQPMPDELRFPHLSQLPKRSIIRQKCINSPMDVFIKNGSLQDACEKLENHIRKYAASKGAWRYERIKAEDRSELEKEALSRVYDNCYKHLAIITKATKPEFEAYLRKQGIDPEGPKSADWKHLIYDRECEVIGGLFYMTRHKYEAKHALDEAIRQENLTEATRMEDAFAKIDSTITPDDFRVA